MRDKTCRVRERHGRRQSGGRAGEPEAAYDPCLWAAFPAGPDSKRHAAPVSHNTGVLCPQAPVEALSGRSTGGPVL